MTPRGVALAIIILFLAGPLGAAGKPMAQYDYTFQIGSEPDGFRGFKWQTAIAALDPWRTMDCIELVGEFAYYQKKQEDLHLGLANLESIIYEFWNGRFSSVIITTRGQQNYAKLKDYIFARYGVGQRSPIYEKMEVQDFMWNGYQTRMYLRYSDLDRVGVLSLHSIAMLNKQQRYDTYVIKERLMEKLKELEKQQPR